MVVNKGVKMSRIHNFFPKFTSFPVWQQSDRASTRIVAKDTQVHYNQQQETYTQPVTTSIPLTQLSTSTKRPLPENEAAPAPKQKRPKAKPKSPSADTKTPSMWPLDELFDCANYLFRYIEAWIHYQEAQWGCTYLCKEWYVVWVFGLASAKPDQKWLDEALKRSQCGTLR